MTIHHARNRATGGSKSTKTARRDALLSTFLVHGSFAPGLRSKKTTFANVSLRLTEDDALTTRRGRA